MQHNYEILNDANGIAEYGDVKGVYCALRKLALADFCMLHMHVPIEFPALSNVLPKLPPEDIQNRWVGDSGMPLLVRSCSLVRLFDLISWQTTGQGLSNKRILDYGCGWGRLLRLMNFYSNPEDVVGLDAMQISLDLCKSTGIHNQTALVTSRPSKLNADMREKDFEFVYLFSVFTHTPQEVTKAILDNINQLTVRRGVVVCTIRTIEWLHVRQGVWPTDLIASLQEDYERKGYAFVPLNGDKGALKEADYGDTIMTLAYFKELVERSGWHVVGVDRDMSEPFQICVVLTKR